MLRSHWSAFALVLQGFSAAVVSAPNGTWQSASGDPLLFLDPAVMLTGWNFCNMAKAPPEYPEHPSPRWGDCIAADGAQQVSVADNGLGPGDAFPRPGFNATTDANEFAVEKGLYLGDVCSRPPAAAARSSAAGSNWSYHTVMWKSGNMDIAANICPETVSRPGDGIGAQFNNLAMNQPLVQLQQSSLKPVPYTNTSLGYVGWASGTYDVNPNWTAPEQEAVRAALAAYTQQWLDYRFSELGSALTVLPRPTPPPLLVNQSYIATLWWRNASSGSLVFTHMQQTSKAAPWLMNYYKLTDAQGFGGGYDWPSAGQMFGPVPSYTSRLRATFSMLDGGKGGFGGLYAPCHAGCWKLSGAPCDGDLDTDVTRYICFIAANGNQGCTSKNQGSCPPFHVLSGSHERVLRNDTARFPYNCYSGHCLPGACDQYSNPGPQELMMILPCTEWEEHGYPTMAGSPRSSTVTLDVGALGARVALSGAEPADIGPATRAARGWAPLPDLSTLPPYPGWTRSWNGFDFGVEQPNPGLARYEFTAVDIEVLAAS